MKIQREIKSIILSVQDPNNISQEIKIQQNKEVSKKWFYIQQIINPRPLPYGVPQTWSTINSN